MSSVLSFQNDLLAYRVPSEGPCAETTLVGIRASRRNLVDAYYAGSGHVMTLDIGNQRDSIGQHFLRQSRRSSAELAR